MNKIEKYEVLKKNSKGIQVIRFGEHNTIIGIGDIVSHYGMSNAKIISFKKDPWSTTLTYTYDQLTLGKEKYPKVLRDREKGKHHSSIQNINGMVKMADATKKIHKTWWMHENIRRKGLPKYKVIASYPDSKHRVGEIIKAFSEDTWQEISYWKKRCEKYPHIFKRIN